VPSYFTGDQVSSRDRFIFLHPERPHAVLTHFSNVIGSMGSSKRMSSPSRL
jgi:hypothetical protein